ncbi:SGNH/GDSL hydrolase family protein [Limnovirga soli]|uniref:G-D-S-L family lipolytic protein n=1 Tax=Limnovirga soli TaxID=2656915 RepID=A0A8J8FGC9_9BACT|nr:SGNH/GDSL hydrolase family protein [Limnovirga soli]NNV56167.1 G-D-S-L family lipolytic protein [Limnovirga soli]
MKYYLQSVFFILLITCCNNFLAAQNQQPPFYNEIQDFKKADSLQAPPKHPILFVGSSSFRFWKAVQADFPAHTIINRGFGGSTLPDVIRYANDIIIPYHPKQVVIYCGENDLAQSDTVTAAMVLQRFTTLFNIIRSKLGKVPVVFVSIKPSPSRIKLFDKEVEANTLIQAFLKTQRKTAYADVFYPMLGADGKPMPDLFIEDNLHMNAKGYAIWQKIIEPFLK